MSANCLNLSNPEIQELLKVVPSEPLLSKVLEGFGDSIPTKEEVLSKLGQMKTGYVSVETTNLAGEDSSNNIYKDGEKAGTISLYNDGTYLNVQDTKIGNEKQGIGTVAYTFLGNWAIQNGLMLRSDLTDVRMNDGSNALWSKLVRNGAAIFDGNRYIFIGDNTQHQINSISRELGVSELDTKSRPPKTEKEVSQEDYIKILHDLSSKFNIAWKVDNDQISLGRYQNGVVYINMNKIEADTPFHEFAHPFEQLVKKQNPILWKALTGRIKTIKYKGESIVEFVSQRYPELSNEDLLSESIVTAIGLYASSKDLSDFTGDTGTFIDRLKQFLNKILLYLSSIKSDKSVDISDSKLQYLTLRDISNMIFKSDAKLDLTSETSDNKVWFQKAEDSFNALQELQKDFRFDEPSHTYYYKGNKIDQTVTDLVKDYYKKKFGSQDDRSTYQQLLDEATRENGTSLHKDLENIAFRHIDPATGLRRTTPIEVTQMINQLSVYNTLESYFVAFIDQFNGQNARFQSEVRLINAKADRAGTADFIVHTDQGIRLYDWKSIQTEKKLGKIDELPFYKEEAYRIQLKEYKNMLERIASQEVIYAAAIPFEANAEVKVIENTISKNLLSKIAFGSLDPRLIKASESYLLPVVLSDQKTGDELLDRYIEKLNNLYEKLQSSKVGNDATKRENKIESLNRIKRAIRDLQVRNTVENLKEAATVYLNDIKYKLSTDEYEKSELTDWIKILDIFRDGAAFLEKIVDFDDLTNQDAIDISTMAQNAGRLQAKIILKMEQEAEVSANVVGIKNISSPQKALDFFKKTFRSISTMPIKTLQVFYKHLVNVQNKRDLKTKKLVEGMKSIKDNLATWATTKGISIADALERLYEHDTDGNNTGMFLRKYSDDFWKKKEAALKSNNITWLIDNLDFDQVKYEDRFKEFKDRVMAKSYFSDPLKNKKKQEEELFRFVKRYQVYVYNGNQRTINKDAFTNTENYFLTPKAKNLSKEWKDLYNNPDNTVLKDTYEYFQSILKDARKLGMLDDQNFRFIPNLEANKVERLITSGMEDIIDFKGLLNTLQVDSDQGFGKLDPISGKLIKTIPVYFTRDLIERDSNGKVLNTVRKSKDLFKVFTVFGSHVYDYEARTTLEDDGNILLETEKNKKTYQTNLYGKVKMENGVPVEINSAGEASETYKVVEGYIDFYIYGRTQQSDKDWTYKIGGKEYSGKRTINSMMSYMSLKTLSFNIPSAAANLFGGQANAFFTASKRENFDEGDWSRSLYEVYSRNEKALGMLNFFDIFLEDQRHENANRLSIHDAEKIFDTRHLMSLQRSTDKMVQYPVAVAMTYNHMVIGDKIVSIKKHVRDLNNYDGSYTRLSYTDKKKLDRKINEEVDQLKKTQSIYATATIISGLLDIPGISPDSNEAADFRAKIKKVNKTILGNSTKDDITNVRLSMVGSMFMHFRNWMPQMITERFGDFNFDPDLEQYQMGKTREFLNQVFSKNVLKLSKDLIAGIGTNTIQIAKQRYAEMKAEAMNTQQDFNITETEFIDMYIANLRSQLRELVVLLAGGVLLFSAFTGSPDDDKDGYKKMLRRGTKRLLAELTFYYSPDSVTTIINSPFPVVKVLTDVQHLASDLLGETVGYLTNDDARINKNHPQKYFFNLFPIFKEGQIWWAAIDDDFRKENNIKLQN